MSRPRVEPDELEVLRAENLSLRRAVAAVNLSLWHQIQQMHHFDALACSRCPSCGSPVDVILERGREGQPEGVRLEAAA